MNEKKTPLLGSTNTPYNSVPFNSLKPSHFEPAFKVKIKACKKEFKRIINNRETATLQNTLVPFEIKYDEVSRLGLILFNLNSAETSDDIQALTQKISPLLTKFSSKVLLNKKYFSRIEIIYNNRTKTELNTEELRLIETTYLSMKRNGAKLNFIQKMRLTQIQMKLAKLTLKFDNNILAETNDFIFHTDSIKDLDGLPENELIAASLLAKSKGKTGWMITLQYTSYAPFLKYANKRELREKIYKANAARGNRDNDKDNKKLIVKISNLRLQQAIMLGYKTYADYVLEERMAQTPLKVNSFLEELHSASQSFAIKELKELKEFAKKLGFKDEIMPWDLSFYSEKLKVEKFGFDEAMVKPFFQLGSVIKGVFELATKLYGISFKEIDSIQVYHSDVKTYEVLDEEGKFLSLLYADFHPRESKQGGAWMTEFLSQSNIDKNMIRPHVSICCNFTKPTDDTPSLLTFSEVNTFLHEFGHALHGMFANTIFPSMSGTNVYRDFVELPSQIMENWLTEIDWVQTFATHYKTGEALPKELIQKLIDAQNFQAGYQSERQLTFGMLDMAWHSIQSPFSNNIISFENEKTKATSHLPIIEGSCISTSFSHVFAGGYAVGYYGYKWAEVLDADAFSLFSKEGIFNKEIALKFRQEILEKGGTVQPQILYKNFRGKEATIDALLKRTGLN